MTDAKTICTCDRCGGTNLQLSAWIDAKTGKVLDDDGPLEQAYCLDCEDHVDWSATPEKATPPPDEEDDTPRNKILLTFPIDPENPEDNRAPDGWIEIQRDDSPNAPPGETWRPLAGDDDAALAVCPYTACLYHCETGQMALLSDDEACRALPEGPVICIVPRAIARARYASIGIEIS